MIKKLSAGLLVLVLAGISSSLWSAENLSNSTDHFLNEPRNIIYGGAELGLMNNGNSGNGRNLNIGFERRVGRHFDFGAEYEYFDLGFGITPFFKYYFSKYKLSGWYVGVFGGGLWINAAYDSYYGVSDIYRYFRWGAEEGYQWLFFKHMALALSFSEQYAIGYPPAGPAYEWDENFRTQSDYRGFMGFIRLKLGWAF